LIVAQVALGLLLGSTAVVPPTPVK